MSARPRYQPPPTVSAATLLQAGSDRAFQKLMFDLFTISARIEQVRSHLASSIGISAPQYSVLRAVSLLQGDTGVSIGVVAEHLHVTSTFITAQSRILAQLGVLKRQEQTADRRVCLLSLSARGERLVDEVAHAVRPINDMFFGILAKSEFQALCDTMTKLVDSSRSAVAYVSSREQQSLLSLRDQRMSAADR